MKKAPDFVEDRIVWPEVKENNDQGIDFMEKVYTMESHKAQFLGEFLVEDDIHQDDRGKENPRRHRRMTDEKRPGNFQRLDPRKSGVRRKRWNICSGGKNTGKTNLQ